MSYPLNLEGKTYTEGGRIPPVQEETFTCGSCEQKIPIKRDLMLGYGIFTTTQGEEVKLCYPCCAKKDQEQLRQTGTLTGYWTEEREPPHKEIYFFSNFPGSWKIPLKGVRKGRHNWYRVFQWFGYFCWEKNWYQVKHVSGGWTSIAKVKRIKKPRWAWIHYEE